MTYEFFPFKIIHDDDLTKIIGQGAVDQQILIHPAIYPAYEGKLPILLRWTFRISKGNVHLFSLVGEGQFLLKFESGEAPSNSIIELCKNSLLQLQMYYQTKTNNTPLATNTIPGIADVEFAKQAESIISVAIQQGLL